METWKENEIVFNGKVVCLRVGSVALDDGSTAYREVVEHPGGVCVLPCNGAAFVFVQQYRIALKKDMLEAPAGKLERDESPEQCAVKELREETGYVAGRIIDLGIVYSSVGFCNEVIHLYLAMELTSVGSRPEPEERIEPVFMSVDKARQLLADCGFDDGKTAVVVQRALSWLDANGMKGTRNL
ncbi:MAG TPA: NUDIX hydrolase [Candidatus Hydrogenedentes bacterium]|nr:NUDIX hydrolase [Candidatus Hydrogenedentota bacterium]